MIRIVAPFRPLPAEYDHHKALIDFDWHAAIRMLSASVARSCGVTLQVLTDVDTPLPFPCLSYQTHHRRLMLWSLEIAACYLESAAFDRDTVSLDADQLIFGNLARWFQPGADLGVLVRDLPKGDPAGFPILNGVQFWAVAGKPRLAAFYREALRVAESLPESAIAWGADTLALQYLLAPLVMGTQALRGDLQVAFLRADAVLQRLSAAHVRKLRAGAVLPITHDVLDFRNMQKRYMAEVFAVTLGGGR